VGAEGEGPAHQRDEHHHGQAGGLGNKARGQDAFLPFKIIDAPGKNARITEETARVIRWLISNGQMPQRVLVLALAELERSGF
jgi:hypothetical protein